MIDEVNNAVDFLVRIMGGANIAQHVLATFSESLSSVLLEHYTDHWFPEKPFKGSAYRCIRIVNNRMDPLVRQAGRRSGLNDERLLQMFPAEFTMWIDPEEVSYRIGEDGSIGIVYTADSTDSSDSDSMDSQSSDESLSQDMYETCSNLRNNQSMMPGNSNLMNGISFDYFTAAAVS